MKILNITILIFIFLSFSNNLKADAYDECILKNMKNIDNDTAARAIIQACKNKYKNNSSSKNSISGIKVYYCRIGEFFEIKFDSQNIKDEGVYMKTDFYDYEWKKEELISHDDEQFILKWKGKFNRVRYDLKRNKIVFYNTSNDDEKPIKQSCYLRSNQ